MIYTSSIFGYESPIIEVESEFRQGIPALDIIGISDNEVIEARFRVKEALANAGYRSCLKGRIILSLSPSDLRKRAECLAFPMALEILRNERRIEAERVFAYGRLNEDGSLSPCSGTYAALQDAAAKGIERAVVPNAGEPSPEGITVFRARNLAEALALIEGGIQ